MNETERKALVDELAAAMLPDYHGELATTAYMVRNAYRKQATACLPIIDRLLAAADAPKQLSVEFACGSQEYWDLEPDGSLRIDIPHDRVVVSSTDLAAGITPGDAREGGEGK